jgi:predicted DNA-binding transcriptional regulator AlpA
MSEQDAYSIQEFCQRYRLSQSFYFKMQNEGFRPRVMKVGGRVLISKEAVADWKREREAASNQPLVAAE